MTTTAFRHLAAEAGCLEHIVLNEIRYCLGVRGGVNHDGHHWIYKSAQELANLLGRARNTVAKALRRLVELGLLERQKLGVAVGYHTNRAWFYRLADGAPAWLKGRGNPTRRSEAVHCATVAQSNNSSTSAQNTSTRNSPPKPTAQQPGRGGSRLEQAARNLQARVASLTAVAAPRRLHSELQQEEWSRNPENPENRESRARGGRGFGARP